MPYQTDASVGGDIVNIGGSEYYRVYNYGHLAPFFTTVMSSCDLWLYASSTGALTAGRSTPENSLFPYDTVDRIHAAAGWTGPYTAVRVQRKGAGERGSEQTGSSENRDRAADAETGKNEVRTWCPFSPCYAEDYEVRRDIAKQFPGTRLVFEEVNHTLGLAFSYEWYPAPAYGWVRRATIHNFSAEPVQIHLADGLRNVMPAQVPMSIQQTRSVLADAYRKTELIDGAMGLFTLASGITDRPQACEVLRANVVWQRGLAHTAVLLSMRQIDNFLTRGEAENENEVCGHKGAYLGVAYLELDAGEQHTWFTVADVGLTQPDVIALRTDLENDGIMDRVRTDAEQGEEDLKRLLHAADAVQQSADAVFTRHHVSNVLFNCARGGVPVNNYRFPVNDYADFLRTRNVDVYRRHADAIRNFPVELRLHQLDAWAGKSEDADLRRLTGENLPLAFSRRHGDPSRPWNQFAIQTRSADGTWNYAFQGNWRDIFQNWEALGLSFPVLLERFISVFLNASTVDGFNPYRIVREGIDWEVLDPDDPWSSIGYWGDHQMIYLLKLMQHSRNHHPGRLASWLDNEQFCFGNVPYRLKHYEELCRDPYNSVVFDQSAEDANLDRASRVGGDGKLFHQNNQPYRVNLAEKLLIPVLAKLSNIVPDGGLWLNTGRPEWNDANNALAGNGLSVVTLCHLKPHLEFLGQLFTESDAQETVISEEVVQWFTRVRSALRQCPAIEGKALSPEERKRFLDEVGQAFGAYRENVYGKGFSGKRPVQFTELADFFRTAADFVTAGITANRREDGLFHAYNLLRLSDDGREAYVEPLYEMLEGQVAALDSGVLDGAQTVELLEHLRNSPLYRSDQHSYMLYPEGRVPDFLEKNIIPPKEKQNSGLLQRMLGNRDDRLAMEDRNGDLRFHPDLQNAAALQKRLDELRGEDVYAQQVDAEYQRLLDLYEDVFQHEGFTGRSGGMFAFEGVGCIYWHLVGKLLLAANNAFFRACRCGDDHETLVKLKRWYYDIRSGLGFNKSPRVWGAFPQDAYSHMPASGGAKQPGMTGQVKEEILARWGELGIQVDNGCVLFDPRLLRADEFMAEPERMSYLDIDLHLLSGAGGLSSD